MFVCIPSKDSGLLYNIFEEEEAGSHLSYGSAHEQKRKLSSPVDTSGLKDFLYSYNFSCYKLRYNGFPVVVRVW